MMPPGAVCTPHPPHQLCDAPDIYVFTGQNVLVDQVDRLDT